MEELKDFLQKKSSRSAPGLDKISYDIIKSLDEENLLKLLTAINTSFENCDILDAWRRIKICPIPKKGKDLNDYTSFRPIALISVLIKIINGIIKNRLETWAEDNNILPSRCHAYRKNRSTVTCINEALQIIKDLQLNNKRIVIATVDIDGAYDFVDLEILSKLLSGLNFPIHETKWAMNFLKERTMVLGNEEKKVFGGLPQGSSLSPLLFNVILFNAASH